MPIADNFTALTLGNGMMTCGIKREVKDGWDRWTTFDGVNKDNVAAIVANPAALAGRIEESLKKAMKIWWQMSAIEFTCTASSGDPDHEYPYPTEGEISSVNFEGIEPHTRVCSPSELRSTSEQDPSNTLRYAVASVERALYFTRYFYDGEFVGWGSFTGNTASSFSFLSLESAAAGVRCRCILCGAVKTEGTDTSGITYDYDYVEVGGASFVCEIKVETALSNPPRRVITTTIDATNTKAKATMVQELSDGSGTYTNTCTAEIPDQANGLEYFSFA